MMKQIWVSAAIAAMLVPALPAAVIVANTGAQNGAAAAGQSGSLLLAAGFLSPAATTQMTSVDTMVEPTNGSATLSLSLFSSASGQPGTLISALGTQVAPLGQSTITFTPGSAMALSAATTYFLVMSCSDCNAPPNNNWNGSLGSGTASGLAGAGLVPGVFFSTDNGATWGSVANRTMIFMVNGDISDPSAVPEPGTWAMIGAGLALAGWNRRRPR